MVLYHETDERITIEAPSPSYWGGEVRDPDIAEVERERGKARDDQKSALRTFSWSRPALPACLSPTDPSRRA